MGDVVVGDRYKEENKKAVIACNYKYDVRAALYSPHVGTS
jgi:hypothetical protein